jgi:hypothetical protein
MIYVIHKTDRKSGFVAKPGSKYSYTRVLQQARTWPTKEQAEEDLCPDNEEVLSIEEVLS